MKTWKIPVVWQETATITVVADTLAEAMELTRNGDGIIPLPDDGSYLDNSWELASEDEATIREYYNANQED